jgi:hypothetical protein
VCSEVCGITVGLNFGLISNMGTFKGLTTCYGYFERITPFYG